MSSDINWKQKYEGLKLKFMNSVDMAFRLGYEQGIKDSQVSQLDQAREEQAQQEQMAAQSGMQGGEEGSEGAEGSEQSPGEQAPAPDSAHPDGSELDQHIAKLENMLSKNEVFGDAKEDLKKSLENLKSYKLSLDMKKAEKAIKSIGKSMKTKAPFKLGSKASHNMAEPAKKAVNMQEKIVSDIMKSWEKEESKASESIKDILDIQNLIKKK